MNAVKISIPKMSDTYKLYVYRSKSAEDINTISKIKELTPVLIIDESIAVTSEVDGIEYYKILDEPSQITTGVDYIGPKPSITPVTEYETKIDVVKINDHTYVNQLNIKPLPTKYKGTMLYYVVIGVDEINNTITHLSKVSGIMMDCPYEKDGSRHLYACNDFQDKETDIWNYVGSIPWTKEIKLGDVNDAASIAQYDNPFIKTVTTFKSEAVKSSIKSVSSGNFMYIELPNPWQYNNKEYNYRKLKSYKIQNVYNSEYSSFSEPTFQSELPVSIEKMLILKKTDAEHPEEVIPLIESEHETVHKYQIIRKDGVYYNNIEHRNLGLNKYSIPLEESTGVFSESSVQDFIKMQIEALPNHVYSFTVYLLDIYKNISEPVHFTITT